MQHNPLASIKEIADQIDISWPTAKKRYEEALESKIITRVIGGVNMQILGFRRHFVLADLNDYRSLKTMEELCDFHPYTTYRSRILGSSGVSLFMIFEVPDTSRGDNNIKDFFQILLREAIIKDYMFLTSTGRKIESKLDLDKYDLETERWKFEPDHWLSHMKPAGETNDWKPLETLDLTQFNKKMLYIVRMMTTNMLPTQKELRIEYERQYGPISKSEFHRQYTLLKEEIILRADLIYDYNQFGVSEYFLYILPDLTQNEIESFFKLMEDYPPPFNLTLEAVGMNNIIMWGNIPADVARNLSYQLWKNYSQTMSYRFAIETGWAARYQFYHENFDDETKNWKDDYTYMVDEPLASIRNSQSGKEEDI